MFWTFLQYEHMGANYQIYQEAVTCFTDQLAFIQVFIELEPPEMRISL